MGYGSGFVVSFVNSSFARCGSALEVTGDNFEVYNNTLSYNGWDEYSLQWADGLTVHRCDGGTIHSNQIAENTDVGLVVNRADECSIRWNDIWNFNRYAFAGMHVSAAFDGAEHSDSLYSDNVIQSGYDKMGFGLIVGAEQWHSGFRVADVGTVGWNDIEGAVINLMVDGVDGGIVSNNSMSGAQGTNGMGTCYGQSALNFASAHNGGGLTLQSGSTTRTCH